MWQSSSSGSLYPLLSLPRGHFPVKSPALSVHLSPGTIHFWMLDKRHSWTLEGVPLPATIPVGLGRNVTLFSGRWFFIIILGPVFVLPLSSLFSYWLKRCTTWELQVLSFIWGKVRTAAWETTPQRALRDCSERQGGRSRYKMLGKRSSAQSNAYFTKGFLLLMRSWCHHEGISCFLVMRTFKDRDHEISSW